MKNLADEISEGHNEIYFWKRTIIDLQRGFPVLFWGVLKIDYK